jgi:hypothetical protein
MHESLSTGGSGVSTGRWMSVRDGDQAMNGALHTKPQAQGMLAL